MRKINTKKKQEKHISYRKLSLSANKFMSLTSRPPSTRKLSLKYSTNIHGGFYEKKNTTNYIKLKVYIIHLRKCAIVYKSSSPRKNHLKLIYLFEDMSNIGLSSERWNLFLVYLIVGKQYFMLTAKK